MIARLQQVHLVVDDINSQAKQMKSSYEVSLEPFSASFETLIGLYPTEFDRYRLDEIVVAAIAPVVRIVITVHVYQSPNVYWSDAGETHAGAMAAFGRSLRARVQLQVMAQGSEDDRARRTVRRTSPSLRI